MEHGAPGDPPPGSCVNKCIGWLNQANDDPDVDVFKLLGGVLENFMEVEPSGEHEREQWKNQKARVERVLANYGLSYHTGGKILGAPAGAPSRSLEEILKERNFADIEIEFKRALQSVESDPPAAVTAACSIIEALCKVYIIDNQLPMPSKQTVKPLWDVVQKDLGLHPGSVVDQDLTRVLGGLSSIVDGIGALRTHAGSAHGHSPSPYPLEGRHARLAIHAAHSVITFVLESWEKKKGKQ